MAVKGKPANATATAPASSGSKNVKVKPLVTSVAGPATRARHVSQDSSPPRQTPYERLRELLATPGGGRRLISTVEDLQDHLRAETREKVTLRMKLLWVSEHTYRDLKLIRLHFVDADSPEPLQDQITLFRERYDTDRDTVNSLLLTSTMWNTTSDSVDLPIPGTVVTINDYSNLKLFRDSDCQATIKLRDLTWNS